jgi:DNA-binding Lrp family transcriptional regulator
MRLDATDAAIVRELQTDGRLPFETLAGRVGLSRAAARLRVRRLTDSGAVRLVGVLHPSIRDIGALAHLAVSVDTAGSRVGELVSALPEVARVSLTSGRAALAAEVRASDLGGLTSSICRVRALEGVREVETTVYTAVVKDPFLADREAPRITPDPVDHRLLRLLEDDGRLSFADLAADVGLSAGAVRSRVMRLVRAGAVRITALLDPGALGLGRLGGFTVRLAPDAEASAAEIASWRHTWFLTRCVGRADLLGTVAAESTDGLHAVYERLRALPGVRVTDTWIHLELVKERYDAPLPSLVDPVDRTG